MSDFQINQQFTLITIPFRSFQILSDIEEQKACLKNIKDHLCRNGRLILHIFKPKGILEESWIYPERVQWEEIDPVTGARVVKT
ncbi:hypothetical protein, partial [Pseudomonas sp. 2822-15]|uniref:hypothetical protein n=1 Tax=Pseudomonas sp. 2822-15 TaxID=1712677 RepID=UPI001C441AE0